jgi:hypothetical protein
MRAMKTDGKIIWYVRHDGTAKVVNFKDIPTQQQIMDAFGFDVYNEYFSNKGEPLCYSGEYNRMPVISIGNVPRDVMEKIDSISEKTDIHLSKNTNWVNLILWGSISSEGAKIIDNLVSQANRHLEYFIDAHSHQNEETRGVRDGRDSR